MYGLWPYFGKEEYSRRIKNLKVRPCIVFSGLTEIPLNKLIPSDNSNHKQEGLVEKYTKLPKETAPPIDVLLLDGEYKIIQGHHRWLAAKKRGDKKILCRIHVIKLVGK